MIKIRFVCAVFLFFALLSPLGNVSLACSLAANDCPAGQTCQASGGSATTGTCVSTTSDSGGAEKNGGGEAVFGGGGLTGGLENLSAEIEGGGTGIIEHKSIITVILSWVKLGLMLAGVIAFVAFVWAGFLYLTSFANEENAEKGKKIMVWAAIGIVIILFSYVLVNFFINASL